jgi:hypothetical protein
VNGGRVTSHVHTVSNEKFQANFIPHDPGRHRVDVKFNGEKVPNSPWFVEVKDPNTPLLAPMLVAMGGKGGRKNGENGHDETGSKTNGLSSSYNSNEVTSSLSNNRFSSSTSKLNSELKQSSLFQQSKKEANISSISSSTNYESNNFSSSLKNGVGDLKKKAAATPDYEKTDVGSFSLLNTPALLLGGSKERGQQEESQRTASASTEQLSAGRATYSTTIERSINTGSHAYSSLNKPHETRLKGLNNGGGASTMPKSLSSKAVERKASLHAEPVSKESRTNGSSTLSSSMAKSSSQAVASSSSLQTSTSSYSAVKSSSYAAASSLSAPKAAPAPPSPKLPSYKGTADKCKFVGETVRHFNAGKPATFEMFAPGAKKTDVEVNIISE